MSIDRSNFLWHRVVGLGLAFAAGVPFVVKYLNIVLSNAKPHIDIRRVWKPLAQSVLQGADLYVAPSATDIKPPLWLLSTIVSEYVGSLTAGIMLTSAIANLIGVYLIYEFVFAFTDDGLAAVLATGLALLLVNSFGGYAQNKTIIATLGLLALRTPSARRAGVALGIALSIVQYAIFLIPGLAWYWWKQDTDTQFRGFYITSTLTFILTFVPVIAIWGWESLVQSILWSYGSAAPYLFGPEIEFGGELGKRSEFAGSIAKRSFISNLPRWALESYRNTVKMFWVALFGAIGILAPPAGNPIEESKKLKFQAVCVVAVGLGVSLLIRWYDHYYAMVVIPLGILAGVGISKSFRSIH